MHIALNAAYLQGPLEREEDSKHFHLVNRWNDPSKSTPICTPDLGPICWANTLGSLVLTCLPAVDLRASLSLRTRAKYKSSRRSHRRKPGTDMCLSQFLILTFPSSPCKDKPHNQALPNPGNSAEREKHTGPAASANLWAST